MLRYTGLLALLCLFDHDGLSAGQLSYQCKIEQVSGLTDKGGIEPHVGLMKQLIGARFSIDRQTGTMIGSPFSTHGWNKTIVVDRGSAQQAYKAIAISHGPFLHTLYVEVQEFQIGALKPFLGVSGGQVHSGLCE